MRTQVLLHEAVIGVDESINHFLYVLLQTRDGVWISRAFHRDALRSACAEYLAKIIVKSCVSTQNK